MEQTKKTIEPFKVVGDWDAQSKALRKNSLSLQMRT